MLELLLILSLYSFFGVTYLLVRRARILYYHWRYGRWLSEQRGIEQIARSDDAQSGVVPNYAREVEERETVEEREYREERNFLTQTGREAKSWLEV